MPQIEGLQMRYQLKSVMNLSKEETTQDWHLIGLGFTKLGFSPNAQTYDRKYIHDKSQRSDVVAFAPSSDFAIDIYTNDPVVQEVYEIYRTEATGDAAIREVVTYNELAPIASEPGYYMAELRPYSIQISNYADGTEALQLSGTMAGSGDKIFGKYNPETKQWTPDDATTGG